MTAAHRAALAALADLVETARRRAATARAYGDDALAKALSDVADTLDRARTILVEEGDTYLDAAWAFVDAGRLTLVRLAARPARVPA